MQRFPILLILCLFLSPKLWAEATTYVWPISNSDTQDPMNTSFGPRINNSRWDMHDGVDLPGECGTTVHAVADGTVITLGDAAPPTWNSRHVLLRVNDARRGAVYVYYFHLQSIAAGLQVGQTLTRGANLGRLGDDDATYCHLHLEFREGNSQQASSRHPLLFLPYENSDNLTVPANPRFNRQANGAMAARLTFSLQSKKEGDLSRVEVDIMNGSTVLQTRRVDFNDKTTINEGNSDDLAFVNDIAVEGYQTSNMVADNRTDLQYGIVLRNLPTDCDSLVARVYDLSGHSKTSETIAVPNQAAMTYNLNFEDGLDVPTDWTKRTSTTGSGTAIANDATLALGGTHSFRATDESDTESASQQAAIERGLPAGRFEWRVGGWLRPDKLEFPVDKQAYLLHFLNQASTPLAAAARLRRTGDSLYAGIAAKKPDGSTGGISSAETIDTGTWRYWMLRLLRVGTREATAVLYFDDENSCSEVARYNWDSTLAEPVGIRLGIGQSFSKVKAVVNLDEVEVTERTF